jgi:hypothetical protein|uniref:Minor capsid protein P11 C-terminal conserved region domain-containing protein n=1 Tax=viral metagenome TaxID=1070528 RepID=A0A6C0LIW8_9ZZZZ
MSSSIVISFSIAILLLVVLLLLVSYNSKCKMDNIERFESDNSINSILANNNHQNAKTNPSAADGSMPLGNIYASDPSAPEYASVNGTPVSSEPFANMNSSSQQQQQQSAETVSPQDSSCFVRDRLTSSDLLPQDAANSKWAQINPAGSGMLGDQNFLTAGYHVGINTIGQSLRNANLQLRSEPPNPQVAVSPWGISTIEPDVRAVSFEIGSSPSN